MAAPSVFFRIHRASVADQAAGALREAIRQGTWSRLLPGEYELARRYGISRPSVRAALAQLAEEGLIVVRHGCRTRLREAMPAAEVQPVACLISPISPELVRRGDFPILGELRTYLAEGGIGWEEVLDPRLAGENPERLLEELVAGRQRVCWVLYTTPIAVQRWFARARIPAMIFGTCHPGIALPSVDWDFHAIGWHAAGRFAQVGHERGVLILPDGQSAGPRACEAGFGDYRRRNGNGPTVVSLTSDLRGPGFIPQLRRLLHRRPHPTAIFTMREEDALSTFVYVAQLGWRVPGDISIISLSKQSSVLELFSPEVTRYRSPRRKLETMATRIIQALLTGRLVSTKPNYIFPNFVLGTTLGPISGSARRRPGRAVRRKH